MNTGRLLLYFALICILAFHAANAHAQTVEPGSNEITLYRDPDFKGDIALGTAKTLTVGKYPRPYKFCDRFCDDSYSSLIVGSNVWAVLCKDPHYTGECRQFPPDAHISHLGNFNLNDNITSIIVTPKKCEPGPNQIALYWDSGFSGACAVKNLGGYPKAEDTGLPTDKISSVKLGAGASAILCQHENYAGDCSIPLNDLSFLGTLDKQVTSVVAAQQGCTAGPGQVALFQDVNHRGACIVKNAGSYAGLTPMGLGREVSSILVGDKTEVLLCTQETYKGTCKRFTESQNSFGTVNDRVASMFVLGPATLPPTWAQVPGNSTDVTDNPLAVTAFEKKMYFFERRENNRIYMNSRDMETGAWLSESGWIEVPGGTGESKSSPTATAVPGGKLFLFVRGLDDQVWVNRFSGGGDPGRADLWSGWGQELPLGKTVVAVGATATAAGSVEVYRVSSEAQSKGKIYRSVLSSEGWSFWELTSFPHTSKWAPSVAYDDVKGGVYVAAVGDNNSVYVGHIGAGLSGNWCPVRGADHYDHIKTSHSVAIGTAGGNIYLAHTGLDTRVRIQESKGLRCAEGNEEETWSGPIEFSGNDNIGAGSLIGLFIDQPVLARVSAGRGVESKFVTVIRGPANGFAYYHSFFGSDIVPEITTRGAESLLPPEGYGLTGQVPGITDKDIGWDTPCANEIAFITHGWTDPPRDAQGIFRAARASLRAVGYRGPVVGFSWNSDTVSTDPRTAFGFSDGIANSLKAGGHLESFIRRLETECPKTVTHLLGHSLGGGVIFGAIEKLQNGINDGSINAYRIDDVQGLALAWPSDDASGIRAVGNVIGQFINYYDPDDDTLPSEPILSTPLGLGGVSDRISRPANYFDVDLNFEIRGNHKGYWGNFDDALLVSSVGALDVVFPNFTPPAKGLIPPFDFNVPPGSLFLYLGPVTVPYLNGPPLEVTATIIEQNGLTVSIPIPNLRTAQLVDGVNVIRWEARYEDGHIETGTQTVTLGCVRRNPTVTILPGSQTVHPGGQAIYTVSVKNNDSDLCGVSTYTVMPMFPSLGWVHTPECVTLTMMPGETRVRDIKVSPPPNAGLGSYEFSEIAQNESALEFSGSAHATFNIQPFFSVQTLLPKLPAVTPGYYKFGPSIQEPTWFTPPASRSALSSYRAGAMRQVFQAQPSSPWAFFMNRGRERRETTQ